MHESSFNEMKRILNNLPKTRLSIVDFGSCDINGSYKQLLNSNWEYIGVDLIEGNNVDIVMKGEYDVPIASNSIDIVISGQTLEHARNPFKLVGEMSRIVKTEGFLILVAPWMFHEHKDLNCILDCFRILPDGMRSLLESNGNKVFASYKKEQDCWGIGKKTSVSDLKTKAIYMHDTYLSDSELFLTFIGLTK